MMLTNKHIEIIATYPEYDLISYKILDEQCASYNEYGYFIHIINNEMLLYIDYNNFNFDNDNFIKKNELLSIVEKMENRKLILNYLLKKYK